jgi:hypothetical protein
MGPQAAAHETGSGAQAGLADEVFGLFQATAGRLYRELSALRRITRR